MGNSQSISDILEERGIEYGEAWLLTGLYMEGHIEELETLMGQSPFAFNWIMILNKLHRILASPYHVDSWKDIAGFATLVVDHLENIPTEGLDYGMADPDGLVKGP